MLVCILCGRSKIRNCVCFIPVCTFTSLPLVHGVVVLPRELSPLPVNLPTPVFYRLAFNTTIVAAVFLLCQQRAPVHRRRGDRPGPGPLRQLEQRRWFDSVFSATIFFWRGMTG